MIELWLSDVAGWFWQQIGEPPPPRDLETLVALPFGISHIQLPDLDTALVRSLLPAGTLLCQDRSLHGCIVACRGTGMIFLRANDPPAERRFTVAHEIAHFLLDYLLPRQHALEMLGPGIVPVLDGERAPTVEERAMAILDRVALGVYVDLMPRTDGSLGMVLAAEQRADRLALELLAPAEELASLPPDRLVPVLTGRFGLPPGIARQYRRLLLPPPRPGIRQWLQS